MLMRKVEEYLGVRRAAGFELGVPEYLLRSFACFAKAQGELIIRIETVVAWASQVPSLNQREHRLQTVARFARYLQAEDSRHQVPPRGLFRHRRTRPTPYIFSEEQLGRLLHQARCLGPTGSLRPHMYSTLLALLYVTGMRISEALNLQLDDVTCDGLLIRRTKFKKSRLLPLHPTTADALNRYLRRRRRIAAPVKHVFISVRGRPLDRSSVAWVFRRLLMAAGLDPGNGKRRPRIHDIRHSFASRALEKCPEGRDNVGRHILALSTYLGHAHVADTYWYLEATPLLMRDISTCCEIHVKGGAP